MKLNFTDISSINLAGKEIHNSVGKAFNVTHLLCNMDRYNLFLYTAVMVLRRLHCENRAFVNMIYLKVIE